MITLLKDPVGFAKSIWFRYFKLYFPYLEMNCWDRDLYQEFSLAALLIKDCKTVKEAGAVVQKEYRQFLRDIGFRRYYGHRVIREILLPTKWWDGFNETNKGMAVLDKG